MVTGDSAAEHADIDGIKISLSLLFLLFLNLLFLTYFFECSFLTVNDPDFWKKVLPDLVTPDTMLERMDNGSLLDERGETICKYMEDLEKMMDGFLDLARRNQLPDRERAICMKLLLKLTLKDTVFEAMDRTTAKNWLKEVGPRFLSIFHK